MRSRESSAAINKTTHDMFVQRVAGLAIECGVCAEYHDRPVFQTDALPTAQSDDLDIDLGNYERFSFRELLVRQR